MRISDWSSDVCSSDQSGRRARFHENDQSQTPGGQGLHFVRLHGRTEEAARLDGNGKTFGFDASRALMPVPAPVASGVTIVIARVDMSLAVRIPADVRWRSVVAAIGRAACRG